MANNSEVTPTKPEVKSAANPTKGAATPNKPTPNKATPNKGAPNKATPNKATPNKAAPTKVTPNKGIGTTTTTTTPNPNLNPNGKQQQQPKGKKGNNNNKNRKRVRSRSPLNKGGDGAKKNGNATPGSRVARRVYVANVDFTVTVKELREAFQTNVGSVFKCHLFMVDGKSRGCAVVEFKDEASAKKAIETMHQHKLKGREMVVKEDVEGERDKAGKLIKPGQGTGGDVTNMNNQNRGNMGSQQGGVGGFGWGDGGHQPPQEFGHPMSNMDTYGLSLDFLSSLGICPPLHKRIFVANLDYKVGEKKLEEIFRMSGKVLRVKLIVDNHGHSKGHGTVEYDHPVEAVQAISMFNGQNLYQRPMSIRMDKYEIEDYPDIVLPDVLPIGLESVGKGLGDNGIPLNVAKTFMKSDHHFHEGGNAMASPVPPSAMNPNQGHGGHMDHDGVLHPMAPPMTHSSNPMHTTPSGNPVMRQQQSQANASMSGPLGGGAMGSAAAHLMGGLTPLDTLSHSRGGGGHATGSYQRDNGFLSQGSNPLGQTNGQSVPSLSSSSPYAGSNVPSFHAPTMRGPSNPNGLNPMAMSMSHNSNQKVSMSSVNFERDFRSAPQSQHVNQHVTSSPSSSAPQSLSNPSLTSSSIPSSSSSSHPNSNMNHNNHHNMVSGFGSYLRSRPAESDTLFVTNLPPYLPLHRLKDRFGEFGDVRFVDSKGVGTGIVKFSNERDAKRAMNMLHRSPLDNAIINVAFY